jgi:Family of unknown function (DUF5398)
VTESGLFKGKLMAFSMDKGKNKKEILEFDMEKDLKDPGKMREMKEKINMRVQELKAVLRQGEDKKAFEETQTLLHGYLAAQKIIERMGR